MKLQRLPDCVRALPNVEARQKAMQASINSALHRQNICPIGQHMSGHRSNRVGVYRSRRHWYIEANFDEQGSRNFENIALAAVEGMTWAPTED